MAKQKSTDGRDDGRRAHAKAGPPSATKNEKREGRARKGAGDAERGIPKVGKHDANRRGSWGGGLH